MRVVVDWTSWTEKPALHAACQEGHHDCADLLLRAGAKPDLLDVWGHSAQSEAVRPSVCRHDPWTRL